MNTFKSFILMLAMTLLLLWIGMAVGGQQGILIAFIFAGVMNFVSYWFSDKIVLMMYRAKRYLQMKCRSCTKWSAVFTQAAHLPMPKLYLMQSATPNAFATGRNPEHAAVAVTTGIVDLLNDRELGGVIAHELSHVGNRDILISSIAATIAGADLHAGAHQ